MRRLSVVEMSNMRSLNSVLVLCFAVLLFDRTSICLYEDQAGTFDWRQQYVGKANFIEYIQGGQSGTRIVVGTEQNVVAAINGKNGQIGWRQVLEKGSAGRIDDLHVSGHYVVAASAGGEHVRCFNSISGSLHWEATIPGAASSHPASIHIFGSSLGHVAVLSIDRLTVFSLELGNELWNIPLADSGKLKYAHVVSFDEKIYAVGVSDRSHVSVVSVRQDGSDKISRSIPASWITCDNKCSVLRGAHLVCIDKSSAIVQVLSLANGSSFMPLVLQDMKIDYEKASFPRLQLMNDAQAPVVMAMQVNDRDYVLIAIDNGKATILRYLPKVAALQVMSSNEQWTLLTVKRSEQADMLSVNGFDLLTGASVPDLVHSLKYPSHHGEPFQLYGTLSRTRDGTPAFNILLLAEDHSLVLLPHSGKGLWTREEALASILSVEMVDLPVSQIMAKMEDEFGTKDNIFQMFLKRFSTQLAQLWTFALQLKQKLRIPRQHHHPSSTDGAGGEVDKDDGLDDEDILDESYLTRDDFNLHKIIVVTTSPGKVFGLDTNTGLSIWKTFYPNLGSFVRLSREVLPLFVQRTTAHFPHQPVCTVLGKDKVSGLPLMFSFHPITGLPSEVAPPEGRRLNYKIVNAVMLTQMDDQFMHPLVVMDSEKKFYVYPESDADLVKEFAASLFLFATDVDTGIVTGYGLATDDKNQLVGNQLWTVDTNRNTQTISKVITKRAIEHVHSQGIVLEDRSVQYKYLNPNLVAVLTEGEEPQQKASAFFSVYLIDGVTGNLVFHCTHKRSKGPVHLMHSENWVVYNYWNQKQRRMELAVLELYEGTHQSNATAFSSFHPPPPPIVMRQAYIFPGHIAAMATTITEKGITSKQLLFALETGGILGLPKILIDPRRPEVLSQEAREEGLVPYLPELPRPPDHIINYHQNVFNIRGIHTAPAGLESTSLVLCYGLDLFYTRVMPSKMFDVLKEDFDYFFISSVLVGMIAVSLITQRLAARKALNRAWK